MRINDATQIRILYVPSPRSQEEHVIEPPHPGKAVCNTGNNEDSGPEIAILLPFLTNIAVSSGVLRAGGSASGSERHSPSAPAEAERDGEEEAHVQGRFVLASYKAMETEVSTQNPRTGQVEQGGVTNGDMSREDIATTNEGGGVRHPTSKQSIFTVDNNVAITKRDSIHISAAAGMEIVHERVPLRVEPGFG